MTASARLPPQAWLVPVAVLAVLLCRFRRTRGMAAMLAGVLLAWSAGSSQLEQRLPDSLASKNITFDAQIIEFPSERNGNLRLLLAPAGNRGLPRRVRLSWFGADAVPRPGETWRFKARLRAPRGNRNPGGFDYAGWLHRQRVGASGYVLTARRSAPGSAGFFSLRASFVDRIETLLPQDDATATLLAITTGTRHRISAGAWQRYAATGTSHLMAISGLHIGLAASAAGAASWLLAALSTSRRCLRDLAALGGLLTAIAYAAISGFAVPAQRAVSMALLGVLYLWLRWPVQGAAALAMLAVGVLLLDPLALLAPGYQLSFAAVAILMYVAARSRFAQQPRGRLVHARRALFGLLAAQAALLPGLLPLVTGHFDRLSLIAPLANFVALPVFGVLTVPAALLGLVLDGSASPVGDALLRLAWWSLRAIEQFLAALASLPYAALPVAGMRGAALLIGILPLLAVLLPRGMPGRYLGWLAVLAVCLYRPPPPPPGCADLHTLDVGQGLAQVVRTHGHLLVFDTGPAFRGGGSSAQTTLLPFLRSLGVRRIDRLVVSHADQDHAGGVTDLLQEIPADAISSGEPLPRVVSAPCTAGRSWRWDGVSFRFLHPAPQAVRDGNDASCVLEVSSGSQRALLTGDIEAAAERRLVATGMLRESGWVSVAHHGSRTSSSSAFVDASGAHTAVVSAGYRNRWGFPKADVVARWEAAGARVMTTSRSGAIWHRLCAPRGVQLIDEYRISARRYWHATDS